jgi:hypothetical protein
MVNFHRWGIWRFKNQCHNDYAYEKSSSSSSEDGLAGKESEGFLSQKRRPPASSASSSFKLIMVVLLMSSGLLNLSILGFIAYRYSHRGPANSIFP